MSPARQTQRHIESHAVMVRRAETVESYDQMIGEGNKAGNATVQAAIDGLTGSDQGD